MTNQDRKHIMKLAAELRAGQRHFREEFDALENAKQAILRSVRGRSHPLDWFKSLFSVSPEIDELRK